jgi:hypothetical protein
MPLQLMQAFLARGPPAYGAPYMPGPPQAPYYGAGAPTAPVGMMPPRPPQGYPPAGGRFQ